MTTSADAVPDARHRDSGPLRALQITPLTVEFYPAGVTLHRQGAEVTHLLHVDRGLVLVGATNLQGDDLQCAIRGPGTTLGLGGLVGEVHRCHAEALTPVGLCRVPVRDVLASIDEGSPCFGLVRLALSDSVFWQCNHGVTEGPATQRVARLLLNLDRHAEGEPVVLARTLLARAARIRPETLSRALARLRQEGLIGPERVLAILDRAALVEHARVA